MVYRLRATLQGHSSDVRSITSTKDGAIISGSRDRTCRIWKANSVGQYSETLCLVGHDNFISAVCFIEPSKDFPNGAVITGSHDSTINGYTSDNARPDFVLIGHSSVVCCLFPASNGKLLSASWDNSVRSWDLLSRTSTMIYDKHPMAVWSVIDVEVGIVTGCADKIIRVFSEDGDLINTCTGHTDCVRALSKTGYPNIFLSCANDALIIKWDASNGTLLNTYYGHPNYIYCLASDLDVFVSGGEDGVLKVWSGIVPQEDIPHPDQSVWCVTILPNKDIVTGGSDGVVRIFTNCEERSASEEEIKVFLDEAKVAMTNRNCTLGGYKLSDLPGKSALNTPGHTDGQVIVVQENGLPKCFSWSNETKQWNFVGDVMGSVGGSTRRPSYNGREYDYIFSIDVEGFEEPLKLPYNSREDPWTAAQAFIHKYNINQAYLEQIANFIIKNGSPVSARSIITPGASSPGLRDPFGDSGFLPAPSRSNGFEPSSNGSGELHYFPHLRYLQIELCDPSGISRKLKEFSQEVGSNLTEAQIDRILSLTKMGCSIDQSALFELMNLLAWPSEKILPVLDVIRMVIRNKDGNSFFCQGVRAGQVKTVLLNCLRPASLKNNKLIALRIITNMFSGKDGEQLALQFSEPVLDSLPIITNEQISKNFEMAISTTLLNYIVAGRKNDNMSVLYHSLQIMEMVIPRLKEPEALFRVMVGLGNVLSVPNGTSLNTFPVLDAIVRDYASMKDKSYIKVTECCKQILHLV